MCDLARRQDGTSVAFYRAMEVSHTEEEPREQFECTIGRELNFRNDAEAPKQSALKIRDRATVQQSGPLTRRPRARDSISVA